MKQKILVVDDEKDILELIEYNLTMNGYKVETAGSGEIALELLNKNDYDLILLDIMLPGMDGLDICKKIKFDQHKSEIPVIMVTAKGEEIDRVTGLEIGADYYVTKPFSPRELLAIVKAALRRNIKNLNSEVHIIERRNLQIYTKKFEVYVNKKRVELTTLEFKILLALAKRPGWVMTRFQIVDATQGDGVFISDRTIDVHIASLRKKLGEQERFIETVRGVGYKFREDW